RGPHVCLPSSARKQRLPRKQQGVGSIPTGGSITRFAGRRPCVLNQLRSARLPTRPHLHLPSPPGDEPHSAAGRHPAADFTQRRPREWAGGTIMFKFTKFFATKSTQQSEPIPGTSQVPNSAGSYAWQLDDWQRLDRFLVLGTEGGTYYVGERELTIENAN